MKQYLNSYINFYVTKNILLYYNRIYNIINQFTYNKIKI